MNAVAQPARHPAIELLARYRAILSAAWQVRHELAGPRRMADEAAFLPAALSLQETPPHPAPRRFALVLCGLFVLAVAWAWFGKVDIVAVAPGRIVVSERTKVIQPLEAGVVRRILVKDGDRVQAGQMLVELDATMAQADGTRVAQERGAVLGEALRSEALLLALASGRAPVLNGPVGDSAWPPAEQASARALLASEWQDISAKLAKLQAEARLRQAELATARQAIEKLRTTLPLAQQRESDILALSQQGFVAGHAGQDRMRERIELERDLATAQAREAEMQAALAESEQSERAWRAETLRALRERATQARLKVAQLVQEAAKTAQRATLTQLTAPVNGIIQQLAVHTTGGVVTPAQALMVVVPDNAEVTAEVVLENKDIGFVHEGQEATIKLETFPYTRFGTVTARVKAITADAVADEKRGAIFPATLQLEQTHLSVEGRAIRLAPGMNLTAEIRTGQRRVADYLLSPLQQHVSESLKER